MRTVLFVVISLISFTLSAESTYVVDQSRDRKIPVEIYESKEQKIYAAQADGSVAILSAGYGVPHTKYKFIANAFVAQGYLVLAVRHEPPGDPLLSTSGDLYQTRIENWRRGAETLRVVAGSMKKRFDNYDFDKITLIGHSNGGDISAWLANQDAAAVDALITLDHRRVPIPKVKRLRVLSLRAGDFPADEGIIPSPDEQVSFEICIVKFPKALHNNMTDDGPEWLKNQIQESLLRFSSGELDCSKFITAKTVVCDQPMYGCEKTEAAWPTTSHYLTCLLEKRQCSSRPHVVTDQPQENYYLKQQKWPNHALGKLSSNFEYSPYRHDE